MINTKTVTQPLDWRDAACKYAEDNGLPIEDMKDLMEAFWNEYKTHLKELTCFRPVIPGLGSMKMVECKIRSEYAKNQSILGKLKSDETREKVAEQRDRMVKAIEIIDNRRYNRRNYYASKRNNGTGLEEQGPDS